MSSVKLESTYLDSQISIVFHFHCQQNRLKSMMIVVARAGRRLLHYLRLVPTAKFVIDTLEVVFLDLSTIDLCADYCLELTTLILAYTGLSISATMVVF
jgi:hypothetical protein